MYINFSNLHFSVPRKILMTSRNISDALLSGLGSWLWWARATDVKVCTSRHFGPYDLRFYDDVVSSASHFFLLCKNHTIISSKNILCFLCMLKMDTVLFTSLSSNYDDKDEKPFPFSCFETSFIYCWINYILHNNNGHR
jgi:hypothetical protein